MLKCKACGADIPFVPDTQTYVCPYCDTVHTHEELTEQEKAGEIKAREHVFSREKDDSGEYIKMYVYTCPQCGGELLTTEETYATFCSYCGSSVLLEQSESREIKPRYIIPFQISKEKAVDIYNRAMQSAIFAPSYIRHMDVEKVRGIYMPYWTYDVKVDGHAYGSKTTRTPQTGGTLVNKYNLSTQVDMKGNGIEYDAASTFPDDLSQAAGPFLFHEVKGFAPSYMSGFYADRGNMPEEAYKDDAIRDLIHIGSPVIAQKLGIPTSAMHMETQAEAKAQKAMYPVWFIAARNRSENKVSYAVINGQTGKLAADVPTDPLKLLLGTLVLAVPLFLLLYLLVAPTPRVTAILTLLLGILGGFVSLRLPKKYLTGATASFFMNLLAVLLCVGLIIANPFRDWIYYLGIGIADLLCFGSYINIFHSSNKNVLRDLPQLGKRGGDA